MRIFSYFLFAAAFFTTACSKIETVEVKDDDGHVIERYMRRKSDFAKEGKYEKFAADGVKIEEASYRNDTLHGQRTLFYENGKPQYVEQYKNGLFEGPYRAFHDNEKLKLEGNYAGGAMTGEWKAYYPSGQLKEIVRFENNEENGPFTEYHDNGKLKAEGSYLEGDYEHGELKLYDEQGELFRRMMCDRGICKTIWLRDSTQLQNPAEE